MSWRDRPYAKESFGPSGGGMRLGLPRLTPVVKWLILVNVAVAVLGLAFQLGHYTLGGDRLPLRYLGALYWDRTVTGVQLWRLITYQYLHAGPFHLLFNLLVLWFAGPQVERQFGRWTFLAFYTACGAAAAAAFLAMVPIFRASPASFAVGASGSVLGVLAALAMLDPRQTVYLFFLLRMRMRTLVLGLAGVYLFVAIVGRDLAHVAHLGGMAAGWLWIVIGRRYEGRGGLWQAMAASSRIRRSAGRWHKKQRELAVEQAEVDRILAKVHDQGIGSLTRREKRTLRQATERQRELERERDRQWRQ